MAFQPFTESDTGSIHFSVNHSFGLSPGEANKYLCKQKEHSFTQQIGWLYMKQHQGHLRMHTHIKRKAPRTVFHITDPCVFYQILVDAASL